MPQAIEWSLATPKMSAVFPSSNPIRDLATRACWQSSSSAAYHRAMTAKTTNPTSAPAMRAALAGTRALLLDMDGVIVSAGQLIPGAADAIARLEATRLPVPDRDQHLGGESRTPVVLVPTARGGHPARAVHVGAVGLGRVHRARTTRASRCTSSPRTTRSSSSAASTCSSHDEAGAPGATRRGRPHRRLARGGDVREPQPRLPPDPARCDADRHAPQPVVADAGGPDARLRGVRRRARVLVGRQGGHRRQAVADVLLERGRRPPSPAGARPGRATTSRWSATTSDPTCWPPSGPACAGSSPCPASTGRRTSRPRSARARRRPSRTPSRASLAEVVAALD